MADGYSADQKTSVDFKSEKTINFGAGGNVSFGNSNADETAASPFNSNMAPWLMGGLFLLAVFLVLRK